MKTIAPEANVPLTWSLAPLSSKRGVVLLLAGLNNQPEIMQPLATALQAAGFATAIVSLSGQTVPTKLTGSKLAKRWLEEFGAAYAESKTRFPDLPVYGLGYSLGATVIAAAIEGNPSLKLERLVFLAPAISLQPRSWAIRLLTPLSGLGICIPSRTPLAYRANNCTTLGEYRATFQLADELKHVPTNSSLRIIPTLAAMSRKDELVSWSRTQDWLRENDLLSWRLTELTPMAEDTVMYQHLVVDEHSLGTEQWESTTRVIADFLRAK